MKTCLRYLTFLILIAQPIHLYASSAEDRYWSTSFSLPNFLSVDRHFKINEKEKFVAFVGAFPISTLFFLDSKLNNINFSETHDISYTLNAWIYTSGIQFSKKLSSRWALNTGFSLTYLQGGADLHIQNSDTNAILPFLNVGVHYLQPIVSLGIERSWKNWSLSLNLDYYMPASASLVRSGWFSSFQEVAPDYKDSIEDGADAAEDAITTTLDNMRAAWKLLPGISLRYRF